MEEEDKTGNEPEYAFEDFDTIKNLNFQFFKVFKDGKCFFSF